jgi:hypothetical protein
MLGKRGLNSFQRPVQKEVSGRFAKCIGGNEE